MQQSDAISLIQNGITGEYQQRWADLGSGAGTFTLALKSLLPAGSHITAVDKQSQNLPVDFIKANFEKDDLNLSGLDGIMMANSFHYVRDKEKLIKKLESYFSAKPTFLIVEYDTQRSNPWVPYPITFENLGKLFTGLGYESITMLANRPSVYSKAKIYAALIR